MVFHGVDTIAKSNHENTGELRFNLTVRAT